VAAPRLLAFNTALAAELGFDRTDYGDDAALAALFAGNCVPTGATPMALAYAGHQFGNFVPQLGDGRAILMGEVEDRQGGLRDIQWKGAGRTPYSRSGDGRAALGPVLREYLVSEAMHALGVPTTRALAAVATGEPVYRDTPLPGAVLTRVAASHIRVGTFQYFAARGDTNSVRQLADHVIARHYPAVAAGAYLQLLQHIVDRQCALIARWLSLGFIHGVMNTDNVAISGETLDYGPCAFMEAFAPDTVFSAIDRQGRYAYGEQPRILQWNLARLAETLLPFIDPSEEAAIEKALEVLSTVPSVLAGYWLPGFRHKLGLTTAEDGDTALIQSLLQTMHQGAADFTLTFRQLAAYAAGDTRVRQGFKDPQAFDAWGIDWRARLAREGTDPAQLALGARLRCVNPAYIPRNHRVQEVISAAMEGGDFAPFQRLLAVVTQPWEDREADAAYAAPATAAERITQTFCGT
jgi:uncharacterized protein YdiU (UPF0061 family)